MSDDERSLAPYRTYQPTAYAAPSFTPAMPKLPSSGGYFARKDVEQNTKYVHATTQLIHARVAQTHAATSLVGAQTQLARAMYAYQNLPATLQAEYEIGLEQARHDREVRLLQYQEQVAAQQLRAEDARRAAEAAQLAYVRDQELRNLFHESQILEGKLVIARLQREYDQFVADPIIQPPAPQHQHAPSQSDAVATLRAAYQAAIARNDHVSAEHFAAALAALAPKLQRTGT